MSQPNSITSSGASVVSKAQKLFTYIEQGETAKFETLIDEIANKKDDLRFVLNQWTCKDEDEVKKGHYLLTKATDLNRMSVFKSACCHALTLECFSRKS